MSRYLKLVLYTPLQCLNTLLTQQSFVDETVLKLNQFIGMTSAKRALEWSIVENGQNSSQKQTKNHTHSADRLRKTAKKKMKAFFLMDRVNV